MLGMRRAGPGKDAGELRPGIRAAHINDADRLDPRLWWVDPEQRGPLAVLDTAPELALRGDDEVLKKRVGMGCDLDPLAAAGNNGQHRNARRHYKHIMLQLRHMLFDRRLLRER